MIIGAMSTTQEPHPLGRVPSYSVCPRSMNLHAILTSLDSQLPALTNAASSQNLPQRLPPTKVLHNMGVLPQPRQQFRETHSPYRAAPAVDAGANVPYLCYASA